MWGTSKYVVNENVYVCARVYMCVSGGHPATQTDRNKYRVRNINRMTFG